MAFPSLVDTASVIPSVFSDLWHDSLRGTLPIG